LLRGLLLEGPAQQHGDLLVGDRARAAWAKLIVNTLETMFDKALPPLAHRRLGPVQTLRDLLVGNAFGGQQHQPGTRYKSMRKTAEEAKPAVRAAPPQSTPEQATDVRVT